MSMFGLTFRARDTESWQEVVRVTDNRLRAMSWWQSHSGDVVRTNEFLKANLLEILGAFERRARNDRHRDVADRISELARTITSTDVVSGEFGTIYESIGVEMPKEKPRIVRETRLQRHPPRKNRAELWN